MCIRDRGTGIRLFFHMFYILLVLLIGSYLWAWLNVRGLEISHETFTNRSQVGEMVRERISVLNTWPIPRLWFELLNHSDMPKHQPGFVAYLPGRDRRRWMMRTPCIIRGKFRLGPITLASSDPFGIFRVERQIDVSNEVLVYPQTASLPAVSYTHLDVYKRQLLGPGNAARAGVQRTLSGGHLVRHHSGRLPRARRYGRPDRR